MHEFSSGSSFQVNAEVDSMGGVVDGGVGIGMKPSPRQAAIEKAQAELRLEYEVREERRKELEFLEKGGNPLDFKFGHASSVSVQSTSRTDEHPDQSLTSEAKGSSALTASPRGDSVESSGRLGVTTAFEPNSADNFDGENDVLQNVIKSMHTGRSSIIPSENSSQLDGSLNVKESEDSPIFHPKKGQAYRRRNRSWTNRDGTRSSSADMAFRGGHASTPGYHGMLPKPVASDNQLEVGSDDTNVLHSSKASKADECTDVKLNVSPSKEHLVEVQTPNLKADDPTCAARTVDPALITETDNMNTVDFACRPYSGIVKTEDNATSTSLNSTGIINGDVKRTPDDAPVNIVLKGLDSESSCTKINVNVDGNGNFDRVLYDNLKSVDKNVAGRNLKIAVRENSARKDDICLNEKHVDNAIENGSCTKEDLNLIGHKGSGFTEKDHCEDGCIDSPRKEEAKRPSDVKEQAQHEHDETKSENGLGQLDNCIPKMESSSAVRLPPSLDHFPDDLTRNGLIAPSNASESQDCTKNPLKQLDKASEDRILEEAQIIEAKRKRIAELSIGLLPREQRHKSHWDFVLEEMAWLANDFMQERAWKMIAAAQICHRVALASRIRLEEQSKFLKQKSVAHILAKAVGEFWQSVRLSIIGTAGSSQLNICNQEAMSGAEQSILAEDKAGNPSKDKPCHDMLLSAGRKSDLGVYKYAVRFLQWNCSPKPIVEVEVPETPVITRDIDYPEVSWQDQFTEENLFYVIPPGAMEIYRKSIESCLADCEKFGNLAKEEVDTLAYDAAVEVGYRENDYQEDEGEHLYYLPRAIDTGKPLKKKRKSVKSYAPRSYESFGRYGHMPPQSVVMEKRPANSLHVHPVPTKRMRTASRQRVVGPSSPGPNGVAPVLIRADASSGDTNSYPDDQSPLHGGSVAPRGFEVNSIMNFEKQSTFDSAEVSAKLQKKKKMKHQRTAYDQRWQLDSLMQIDQKDVRKRLDSHNLESNGHCGSLGQHTKKPKLMKLSLDNSFDNRMSMSGSVASPAASQMSNISSQSKIIKLIGGRDRASKAKGLKVSSEQLGSGSPWTVVEDQALVVLVHDMGPNWELVSDSMNSILQFKCIFRNPQECKERHKFLMDRPSGDGTDSAEDSGSSQPYPSTLPGIPKGSARQLFRSLHAALEEDNIKSRFEKIIYIEQQLRYRKKQGDNQDLNHIAPIHSSHIVALTQVIPNNVNGGVLTPFDLCDTAASNQDPLSIGYSSHTGGFPLPKQGSISSMHPSGGLGSPLQGLQNSPSMGITNNVASPSSQYTSSRDARYAVPRTSSLPIEEQQRLHQYNFIHPGRNVSPASLSTSGNILGNDRGVRMLPGGNSGSMLPGTSRPVPITKPGLQGVASSSMLNSGNVLTSNMGGMPSSMNVHSGPAASQGNTMFRSRDALHVFRPTQSSEHQRQMVLPETQIITQTSSSGGPSFGGLSSGYSNQAASPPLQTYAGHHQQQHTVRQQNHIVVSSPHPHLPMSTHSATPEQTAYIRIARERQLQQRMLQLQHQHQQHPASSALMARVQSSSQLPLSSPLQNSSQLQSPSSQPVAFPSLSPPSVMTPAPSQSQQQQKHQLQSQGLGRSVQSGAGLVNQIGKQRQQLQQQYQQSARQHPQQRQQSQSQLSKTSKGNERSNMLMHQALPIDPSLLNGLSANPATQVPEKAEPTQPLVHDQSLYSVSGLNTLPTPKSPASSTQPQKQFAITGPASSNSAEQLCSHLHNDNQGQSFAAPSPPVSLNQVVAAVLPSTNHQQLQGQPYSSMKVVNQSQSAIQRETQQNCQANSNTVIKSQADRSVLGQRSSTAGGVPACVDSSGANAVSNSSSSAVRKVLDSVCDSLMTSASFSSAHSNSQAVINASGNELSPSVSEGLGQMQSSAALVSHGHGSEWQNQSSQIQPPLLVRVLPLKQQLQQHDQPPLKIPQPQIQSGQSSGLTKANISRLE